MSSAFKYNYKVNFLHCPNKISSIAAFIFSFFLRGPSFTLNGSFQQVFYKGRLGVQLSLGDGVRS